MPVRTLIAIALAAALAVPASAAADDGPAEFRVVGGSSASIAQYPWQAAVDFDPSEVSGNGYQRQFCGGSLITSRVVLTAGHCVADTDPDCGPDGETAICLPVTDPGGDGTKQLDPDDVNVILGRTTLTDSSGTEIDVQRVELAPGYVADGAPQNDFAYLLLSAPSSQLSIKIAGADETATWSPGTLVEVSGWGATAESGPGSGGSSSLRAAAVPIVSDASCADSYGSDFAPANMVCAGFPEGGIDTCFGDSGGPLEAPIEGGGYRLAGITSWGEGCAQAGFPGVYTRVAAPALRDEIAATVAGLEADADIAHENVVGAGARPRIRQGSDTGEGAVPPGPTARTRALRKCKKVRDRAKRKRCVRKARRLPLG